MELEYNSDTPGVVRDWNKSVREGSFVPVGHVVLTYEEVGPEGSNEKMRKVQRFKSAKAGVVEKLLVSKGDTVRKGTPLLRLGPCTHPTVMRDMCAECGMDLRKLDEPNQQTASVSMVHSVPELRVSMEQAQKLGKVDEERLLDKRKLVLLVDLDQTLIHTTNDNVPNNLKDVFHFQLWGHGSVWYHTRIRPHTHQFLDNVSKLYELHICTFGTRHYAYTIAQQLDPTRKLFSDRILSRDECFSQNSKTANLKELFPRGDYMVCIIDDREDVWNFAPNLIHVKPYHFFRHTGDINAPPGLSKKDQDDKTGFEFEGDKAKLKTTETLDDSDSDIKVDQVKAATTPSDITPDSISAKAALEVATDLNLSEEDDSDSNDSGKEEAARDADMEESNDEDGNKGNKKQTIKSSEPEKGKEDETETTECDSTTNGKSKSAENSLLPIVVETEQEVVSSTGTSENVKPSEDASELKANLDSSEEKTEEQSKREIAEKPEEKCESELVVKPEEKGESEVAEKPEEKCKSEVVVKPDEKGESEVVDNPEMKGKSEVDGKSEEKSKSEGRIDEMNSKASQVIEVEDDDDYLLYLEQILKSIHAAFYSIYDESKRKDGAVPDVKAVIPYVRTKVMKDKNISIVFSGVVPTHVPLKSSKAYQIALSLGAHVSEKIVPPNKPGTSTNIEPPTTHVVAARMGTAKVNEARRYKGIHIVTPEWLWTCAERWEHVEEKLYRLDKAKSVKRNPPAHCSSPDFRKEKFECITPIDDDQKPSTSKGPQPGMRKERTPSGRFMDTINPLLSFSAHDIDIMAHEVDDICNESESSSSDDEEELQKEKERAARRRSSRSLSGQDPDNVFEDPSASELTKESMSSSSSSNESYDQDDNLFGCSKQEIYNKKRKRHTKTETETEDEPISVKFRRGEPLPSDIDSLNLMNPSSDDDDDETNEEDEWMAQALEREFLDENSQSQGSFDMR